MSLGRRIRTVLAGLLLVTLAVMLLPVPVAWAQSTVEPNYGTGVVISLVGDDQSRTSFYANGLYWVFYRAGTAGAIDVDYRTSADGETWSNSTEARDGPINFDIFFDGTYLHYAGYDAADDVFYRRGIPNANSIITWSAVEQTVSNVPDLYSIDMAVDTNGYAFIIYSDDNLQRVYVTKNANNDGTWSTEAGFPDLLKDWTRDPFVSIIQLTSGRMLAIYQQLSDPITGGFDIYVSAWNGAGWNAERTTSAADVKHKYQAFPENDRVHIFAGEHIQDGDDCYHFVYDFSTNSFITEEVIYTRAAVGGYNPAATRATDTGDYYVFWEEVEDKYYYMRYNYYTSTWNSPVELVDETVLDGDVKYHNVNEAVTSDKMGIYYQTDPRKIKYKDVSEPANVTTLSPTAITYNAATLRGDITSQGIPPISARGFQYNYSPSATGAGYTEETGSSGLGIYSLRVTDLEADELYWVRAYVVNDANTTYGQWLEFMTAQPDYTPPDEPADGISPDIPDVPTNWTQTDEPGFTNDIPGVGFLTEMFGTSGFPVSFLWFLLLAAVVTFLCIAAYGVGRHTLAIGAAGGLFFTFCAAIGWLDWWLLFAFVLAVISIWRAESVWGVG